METAEGLQIFTPFGPCCKARGLMPRRIGDVMKRNAVIVMLGSGTVVAEQALRRSWPAIFRGVNGIAELAFQPGDLAAAGRACCLSANGRST
jgi:hypothetical protein